jgi:hypothetical protein
MGCSHQNTKLFLRARCARGHEVFTPKQPKIFTPLGGGGGGHVRGPPEGTGGWHPTCQSVRHDPVVP